MNLCLEKPQEKPHTENNAADRNEDLGSFGDAPPHALIAPLNTIVGVIDLASAIFPSESVGTRILTEFGIAGAKLILKGLSNEGSSHPMKLDEGGGISSCSPEEAVLSEVNATIITEDESLVTENKIAQLTDTPELKDELKELVLSIVKLQKDLDESQLGISLSLEVDLTTELIEEIGEEAADAFATKVREEITSYLTQEEKEGDLRSNDFHNLEAQPVDPQVERAKEVENKEVQLRKNEARALASLKKLENIRIMHQRLQDLDNIENVRRNSQVLEKDLDTQYDLKTAA